MESEKVKEIKKALECCSSGSISNCNNCPYDKYPQGKSIVCWDNLSKDALILINELESENKELKKYKFDWLNSEKMHLQAEMEDTEFELYCANKAFKKVKALAHKETAKELLTAQLKECIEAEKRVLKIRKSRDDLYYNGFSLAITNLKMYIKELAKQYGVEITNE